MLQHMQCPLSQRRNADALARTNQGQLIPRRKKRKIQISLQRAVPRSVDTAILRSRWHATPQAGLHRQRGKAFCTRTSGCGSREDQSPPAARHASCLDFRSVARHFCDCPFFEQRQRAPSSHKDAAGCLQGGGYGSIDGVRLQGRHASFLSGSGKRSGACG